MKVFNRSLFGLLQTITMVVTLFCSAACENKNNSDFSSTETLSLKKDDDKTEPIIILTGVDKIVDEFSNEGYKNAKLLEEEKDLFKGEISRENFLDKEQEPGIYRINEYGKSILLKLKNKKSANLASSTGFISPWGDEVSNKNSDKWTSAKDVFLNLLKNKKCENLINLEKDKFTAVFDSLDEFKSCDQLKTDDIAKVGNRFIKLGADKKSGEGLKAGDMFVAIGSDRWKEIDLVIENKKLDTIEDVIERIKYNGQDFYKKIK